MPHALYFSYEFRKEQPESPDERIGQRAGHHNRRRYQKQQPRKKPDRENSFAVWFAVLTGADINHPSVGVGKKNRGGLGLLFSAKKIFAYGQQRFVALSEKR